MTEQEWLQSTDPRPMLKSLEGKAGDRKTRLLGVAFCRRMWRLIPAGACREAVRVAERYADGLATDRERIAVRNRAGALPDSCRLGALNAQCAVHYLNEKTAGRGAYFSFVSSAAAIAHSASAKHKADRRKSFPVYRSAYRAAQRAEARLIRCVFGNPFRPIHFDPTWRTPAVVSLAQSAYDERRLPEGTLAPDRLAVLADALEEAGCSEAAILEHLRGPGPHVRGCWPVDLLLGKS